VSITLDGVGDGVGVGSGFFQFQRMAPVTIRPIPAAIKILDIFFIFFILIITILKVKEMLNK
jgi:hypothetical protein